MIEVITGPMFSGKSEELCRRLVRMTIGGKRTYAVRPAVDTRDYADREYISSLSGSKFPAAVIDNPFNIEYLAKYNDVVGIDEAQFFEYSVLEHVLRASTLATVIVSGLDMDFRGEPFGFMPHLLAVAAKVTKLTAVCNSCGEDAMYTQRLIQLGETIVVGGTESYEARCEKCFSP